MAVGQVCGGGVGESMNQTYNEIHESRYMPTGENTDLDSASEGAWAVIQLLSSRKGFDGWWEDLDPEIQDEIFEEIRIVVTNSLTDSKIAPKWEQDVGTTKGQEKRRADICAHCGKPLSDDWRQGWGGSRGTNDAPYYCTEKCYDEAGREERR